MEYRIRFTIDPDGQFEECNGEARPLTAEEYHGNEYLKDGQPIPYAEYLRYYGNPDMHVYFQCDVERRTPMCSCCQQVGAWVYASGLGQIDMMADSPEVDRYRGWLTPEQAWVMGGYFQDVARECLAEAGYESSL